jgi:nitrous oxide reductase accessory protein NosL
MAAIWVTDFYNLQAVDARKALYVIGSDVLGPMGHEFVPLVTKDDAADFLKEHKGRRILTFEQVTGDLAFQARRRQVLKPADLAEIKVRRDISAMLRGASRAIFDQG